MPRKNDENQQKSNGSNSSVISMPSYQDIEALAYQIHEDKGGAALDNWLEAERVLKGVLK